MQPSSRSTIATSPRSNRQAWAISAPSSQAPRTTFVAIRSATGHGTSGQLSVEEVQVLRAMGARGLDADENTVAEASRSNLRHLAMEYGQMVASADSLAAVTMRLGVKPSRVRQRLGDRSLHAIEGRGGKVFPRFQFVEDGVLPGFGRVLARIDPHKHPVAVQRFFLEPTSALESGLDDEPISPRDWLLAGLPVEPVAQYAEFG